MSNPATFNITVEMFDAEDQCKVSTQFSAGDTEINLGQIIGLAVISASTTIAEENGFDPEQMTKTVLFEALNVMSNHFDNQ